MDQEISQNYDSLTPEWWKANMQKIRINTNLGREELSEEELEKYKCHHSMEVDPELVLEMNPELEMLPEFHEVKMTGLFCSAIDYTFPTVDNFVESIWHDGARYWSTGVPITHD